MSEYSRFEDLPVWQAARELTREIYAISNQGAFARDYGLRDQMRRAAVSVMSNIAEGFESRTRTMFVDFLGRAKGSAGEVRCQAYVALDAGFLQEATLKQILTLTESSSRQIKGLMAYLEAHPQARVVREADAVYEI